MLQSINRFLRNQAGASALTYGLITALVAVAAIPAVNQLGRFEKKTFNKSKQKVNQAKNRAFKRSKGKL